MQWQGGIIIPKSVHAVKGRRIRLWYPIASLDFKIDNNNNDYYGLLFGDYIDDICEHNSDNALYDVLWAVPGLKVIIIISEEPEIKSRLHFLLLNDSSVLTRSISNGFSS